MSSLLGSFGKHFLFPKKELEEEVVFPCTLQSLYMTLNFNSHYVTMGEAIPKKELILKMKE